MRRPLSIGRRRILFRTRSSRAMHHHPTLRFAPVVVFLCASFVEAVVLDRRSRRGGAPFDWYEMIVSLADMAGRRLLHLLPFALGVPVFAFAWQHRINTVNVNSWFAFLLVFPGQEFCYYWYHRAAHRVRFFWATHAVHHSPNQLALSTAYRLAGPASSRVAACSSRRSSGSACGRRLSRRRYRSICCISSGSIPPGFPGSAGSST